MKENKTSDLMVELNIIEAPMFNFTKKIQSYKVSTLMSEKKVSDEAKTVLEGINDKNPDTEVEYKSWVDGRGKTRELIVASTRETPTGVAMDVFFALIKKIMIDNHPVDFDENGCLSIKDNSTNFTLYELCKIMNISPNKRVYKKIREAIFQLRSVEYYSVGSLYNKEKKMFEDGVVESVGLVDKIRASAKNDDNEIVEGNVVFSDLVLNNLRAGYVRILRNDSYFHIRSGISRAMYIYIENNRDELYTKRSFQVISDKIPIPYKYKSDFKKKLSPALKNLIEAGIIANFFYGDEFLINGLKEESVYFVFKGTKADIIKQLEDKYAHKNKNVQKIKPNTQDELKLEIPKHIEKELEQFGINSSKIDSLVRTYSKWKLIEYILWLKDGIKKGKVKDPAGMFVFAITDEMVKVNKTHPQITEFVEKIKNEIEGKKIIDEKIIKESYEKYINEGLMEFKEEEEFVYDSMTESIISDIESIQKKRIKSQKQLYNMAESEKEKDKLLKVIEKWEKFSSEREKSEIFKEMFVKKIKLYKNLLDYEDFKREYKNN